MQHYIIKNILSKSGLPCLFALLIILSGEVLAEDYYQQAAPYYSPPATGNQLNPQMEQQRRYQQSDQNNPWVLPPVQNERPGFGQRYDYRYHRFEENPIDQRSRSYRFVTPEILQSLKRQQTQNQLLQRLPEQQYPRQQGPRQQGPGQKYPGQRPVQQPLYRSVPGSSTLDYPLPGSLGQSYYGLAPYASAMQDNRFSDPLYDAPSTSPWGGGPDILYRGESFPWLPNAAIGGLPPIDVPLELPNVRPVTPWSLDEKSNLPGTDNKQKKKYSGVFNPYDFAPNSKW